MQALNADKIVKVYSGLPGCMCGCRGKWTRQEQSARSIKIITGKLLRDPDTKFDEKAQCFYVQTPTRYYAAYFTD